MQLFSPRIHAPIPRGQHCNGDIYPCANLNISPATPTFLNLANKLPDTKWEEGTRFTEVSGVHSSKDRRIGVRNPSQDCGVSTRNMSLSVLKDPDFESSRYLTRLANYFERMRTLSSSTMTQQNIPKHMDNHCLTVLPGYIAKLVHKKAPEHPHLKTSLETS